MDVSIINPLLTAFTEILPQLGFQSVERRKVSEIEAAFQYNGILLNISLFGTVKGAILFEMNVEAANKFASKMMMGMPVTELDAIAKSAISEMGNIICANTCTQFTKIGITDLDISPPTLMISENGEATLPVPKSIVVNFLIDDIELNAYVSLMNSWSSSGIKEIK
jgi:chemotaxis protein CheX